MNADSVNRWLTLAANIGVIAGIVFLAFELQQNNELLEAQTSFNHKESRAGNSYRLASDENLAEIIFKVRNGESLSETQRTQYGAYLNASFVTWEWEVKEGLLGRLEIPVGAYRNRVASEPLMREFWAGGKNGYSMEFIEFMDNNVFID